MVDLVIRGGQVVFEDDVARLDIGVTAGRIAALTEPDAALDAALTVDASGCYVLPGAIDTHTHIRWPFAGRHSHDDFASATAAAAVNGTTTIVDFVPAARGESPLAAAETRVELADGQSLIDFAFHPILTSATAAVIADIRPLIEAGFASFKVYTTYPENRLDDAEVWQVMAQIAEHGGLAGFHAENDDLIRANIDRLVRAGRTGIADFPRSRPALAECEAISMVSLYARRLQSPVWIFHVSGSDALATIAEARTAGTSIQAETCAHYLAFDDSVFTGPDPWRFVITPPIRNVDSQTRMWEAVRIGELSAVASDHCAYGLADKAAGVDDFTRLPAGAPGIDARVPVLWSRGVADGRISVSEFAAISAGRPARALGMSPQKGSIAVGADADIVIMDPAPQWPYPTAEHVGLTDYSLYAGLPMRGRVRRTFVRGVEVARDGVATGRPGHGQFLRRRISENDWAPSGAPSKDATNSLSEMASFSG